jgi:putative PIN family toxin of toxin-antitoxin system
MALEGRVELVSSPALLAELARVLGDKFEADSRAVEQVVAQLALISTTVNPQERVSAISDDPSDNRVLEAALAGNATIVVSGDRHLLKLREWRGIRVLDPAAFLQEFE